MMSTPTPETIRDEIDKGDWQVFPRMFDAIEALKLAPEELGRLARLLDEVIQKARLVITSHASVITAMMDTSSDVVQARVKDGLAGMASRYVQFLLEGGNA